MEHTRFVGLDIHKHGSRSRPHSKTPAACRKRPRWSHNLSMASESLAISPRYSTDPARPLSASATAAAARWRSARTDAGMGKSLGGASGEARGEIVQLPVRSLQRSGCLQIIHRGHLPAVRRGNAWAITTDDLDKYLKSGAEVVRKTAAAAQRDRIRQKRRALARNQHAAEVEAAQVRYEVMSCSPEPPPRLDVPVQPSGAPSRPCWGDHVDERR